MFLPPLSIEFYPKRKSWLHRSKFFHFRIEPISKCIDIQKCKQEVMNVITLCKSCRKPIRCFHSPLFHHNIWINCTMVMICWSVTCLKKYNDVTNIWFIPLVCALPAPWGSCRQQSDWRCCMPSYRYLYCHQQKEILIGIYVNLLCHTGHHGYRT